MTSPDTTTDPTTANTFNTSGQGIADAASRIAKPGSPTGLDDLDNVLNQHTDKTKTELDNSQKTLRKSADGVNKITDGDKKSAQKFKPMPAAGMQPQASAPAPGPMGAPAGPTPTSPVAAPASASAPVPAGMRPIAPQALAELLSRAGVTPESVQRAAAGTHNRAGSVEKLSDLKQSKTGMGRLSPTQLAAAIDEACDANGIPNDKKTRAKWHALYRFLIEHESSNDPDRIQKVKDVNLTGPPASDGGPANAARGLCQVVPGTFKSYHVAGTSPNIFDPVANIAASQRYIIGHYGVEPDAGPRFDHFAARRHDNGYTGY